MTVVSGCPMERASAEAFARLILWMEADYGWDRWRAYDLLTHVARIPSATTPSAPWRRRWRSGI